MTKLNLNYGSEMKTSAFNDFSASIQDIIRKIETLGVSNASTAKWLLEESNISSEDLASWADFDHPVEDSYGRKLIAQGKNWELMVMSWAPGDYSAIHDHGSTQWGAVKHFGSAERAIFEFRDRKLFTQERSQAFAGDVDAVENNLIHQMGNPTDQPFLSLHLYGAHNANKQITADARLFDLYESMIQFTDGGVFFCLPEHQINRRETGVYADEETLRKHHQLMLSRINKILDDRGSVPSLEVRVEKLHKELNL